MAAVKKTAFKFKPFSRKQKQILTWWPDTSPVNSSDGIIADGAIRSGKTLCMSLSFIMWAMERFSGQSFGMCGKTIGSFRRNVLFWLKIMLVGRGYRFEDKRADNLFIVSRAGRTNYFYIFGGRDESSQDLIQGITLAGCFFDEVALMPESFVNQATARCSVEGSKFWFNCNPDGPNHWFKRKWIDRRDEKNLLYIHFKLDDNLSLSEHIKDRYKSMWEGLFYKRYILGLWAVAEGLVYDMFNPDKHVMDADRDAVGQYVSCDYGTQNATVFLLWIQVDKERWCCIREYYYSGRDRGKQKTDAEFADDLEKFLDGTKIKYIVLDPSAASFKAELKKRGYRVRAAENDVVDGIRYTGSLLTAGRLLFDKSCENTLKEFESYVWDEKASERGEDKPIKVNDHAMDAVRYFANTVLRKGQTVKVLSRKDWRI